MRNKNDNKIDNAWKKHNREQRKLTENAISQSVSREFRSGSFRRDGQVDLGAIQLFNLSTTDYITFGINTGGGTTVSP
jgi:hypothetical protein